MPTMTIEEIRTRIEAFLQAYNDHDVEAILSHCTEDVVWEDPNLPAPLTGRKAAAEMVRSLFVALPDLHFPREEIEVYRSLDGRKAAARWHMVATMSGRLDPPGFEPTGRTVEQTGMCAYEFRGGLIARHSMFYDVMSFSQQIGLMPAMDSAPVKALVGVQNLSQKIVRMVKR